MIRQLVPRSMPLVSLVWLVYLVYPIADLALHRHTMGQTVAGAVGLGVFLCLYLQGYGRQSWQSGVVVPATIAAIGFVLTWYVGVTFFGLLIYAASFAGWRSGARQAVLGIALVIALHLTLGVAGRLTWDLVLIGVLMDISVGLSNALIHRYIEGRQELGEAREEIERLAVVAERERIARDLHDVLGQNLTIITLKAQLAARLAARQPAQAAAEMADVEAVSRQALAQLRAVVGGYRSAGVQEEVRRGAAALQAAGITCDHLFVGEALPPAIDGVLALALREAVTNVIRHSGATRCEVALDSRQSPVRLTVKDDGRGLGDHPEASGLRGMRERLGALGGDLEVTSSETGTTLAATVPRLRAPMRTALPAAG
ncbi:MAG: sensor histidine kinase [Chloroflexi bacterium]|nr:sensor histidine kinase [Chloroflexota bacterium]